MIIRFSENRFRQIFGVIKFNYTGILKFLAIDLFVWILYKFVGVNLHVPAVPVSILGGALAIFMAFRNNSAYDRWWEARKIWGGVVNVSRSFATQVIGLVESPEVRKRLVYRHLAWLNALRIQLRKQTDFTDVEPFIGEDEKHLLPSWRNKASQLIRIQTEELAELKREGKLSDIEQQQLMEHLTTIFDLQGKAERIKNTVFPYYYVYFTHLFMWTFIALLPMVLVESMGWTAIPMAAFISFVFYILDKTGLVTEDPFENRAADTPMTSLARTIEIDLRQMLGEESLPESAPVEYTSVGVHYLK